MELVRSLFHNDTFLLVMAGIMPAILLIAYICWKDRKHPEPFWWVIYATMMGCASALLATLFASGISLLPFWELIPKGSVAHAWATALFSAAVPEELAKWFFLYRLSRTNPYFDERFDAIVYAVCIGMGFAGLENLLYLFGSIESWRSVALTRAVFSVPGHFAFAVLMGYYFGKVHFSRSKWKTLRLAPMVWLAPIAAHAVFDGLLMMNHDLPVVVDGILVALFIYFLFKLHRFSSTRIKKLEGW